MESPADVPDCRTFWTLVYPLPAYGGAVAALFEGLAAAVEAPAGAVREVPSPQEQYEAPKTKMERAAEKSGEQVRLISVEQMAVIEPGMISFGKG